MNFQFSKIEAKLIIVQFIVTLHYWCSSQGPKPWQYLADDKEYTV